MNHLALERIKKKKRQYEVADELGVVQSYISNLENGREIPSDELSRKLEIYFGQPISYLLQEIK